MHSALRSFALYGFCLFFLCFGCALDPFDPSSSKTDPENLGIAAEAATAFSTKINFQMSTSATPTGYLADSGLAFGDRGNGLSYGWNQDNTAQARERNVADAPDKRYDTFNQFQRPANPDGFWEVAVPNGSYNVRLVAGDSAYYDSVFALAIEGVLVLSGTPNASQRWVDGSALVTVNDGRLTLSNASGSVNNKICFIELSSVAGAAPAAQTLSSIKVTPATAQVAPNGTQQFSAVALDQSGSPIAAQPAMSWTVSGGGAISASGVFVAGASSGGPFAVSASAGGKSGGASVTVSAASGTAIKVNFQMSSSLTPAGYLADSGLAFGDRGNGLAYGWNQDNTAQARERNVADAPDKRYDTFNQLQRPANPNGSWELAVPNGNYNVRLVAGDSAYYDSVFALALEGALVLSGTPSASQRWIESSALVTVNDGRLTLSNANGSTNNKICFLEVTSAAAGSGGQAPTVASAAAANPSSTLGTTSTLSVLGADDGGEAKLSYSWATSGGSPAPVSFSANASNAAKSTIATFGKAGSYALLVTIRDVGGLAVTSSVNVNVGQALSSIKLTPATAQVTPNGSQQFAASGLDQFGSPMASQPGMSWTVSGGGTINVNGLFSAGGAAGGPFTVGATSGGKSGSASITVTSAGISYSTNFDRTEAPISENGMWTHAGLDWTLVNTAGGFAFGTQSGSTGNGGYDDSYAYLSGFPPNQSVSTVIHLEGGISAVSAEAEILLRWADSSHFARGYECNLSHNGSYAEIVRWNGPIGRQNSDFTYVARGGVPSGVRDGDVFSAKIVGNTITSYLNGVQLASGTDNTYPDGNPGMGFFWRGQQGLSKYGFSSFSATGL
jgi:hypothetical protein